MSNNIHPLQKVLSRSEYKEYLECGHILFIKDDIYGATYPVRRRCFKCSKVYKKEFVIIDGLIEVLKETT